MSKHVRPRKVQQRQRPRQLASFFEPLEPRTLMAVLSGSGGVGGTTQTAALSPGLNLIRYSWENYSIPDEFQILYRGQRIAGDVGLQSGGNLGEKVISATNSSDQLTVKVTAPLQGTAWDFTVEVLPFELNVHGQLGDVIKVDIPKLMQQAGVTLAQAGFSATGFALQSMTNNRGKVATTDTMSADTSKGLFYFVPTVTGQSLNYEAQRSDAGIGDSELIVTNGSQQFAVKLHVQEGFSSSGDDIVTFGTKKLDIYRQEQRLAYLGFQTQGGGVITVDGVSGTSETEWAKKNFNVATNPNAEGRGQISTQTSTPYFKTYINDPNVPEWRHLTTVTSTSGSGITFQNTAREYGTDATGDFIRRGLNGLGRSITSEGISNLNGDGRFLSGGTSKTHDGGRGVDVDDVAGDFFNTTRGVYVASPGGNIISRNPNGTYRVGNPNLAADRAVAVTVASLKSQQTGTMMTAIRDFIDYKLTETQVQEYFTAFQNAGSPFSYYNDPRFFNGTTKWM